jgi:adenylate kinase
MRWVVLGPPGSGKGTQARVIAARFGVPHVSTGDLLRAEKAAGTPIGREAEARAEKGLFLPDADIVALLTRRLLAEDCRSGFVLDGFPRTVAQGEALDAWLAERGLRLDGVLFLDLPFDVIRRRAGNRRNCSNPSCQATYSLSARPPAKPGVCDLCGSPLIQRPDDRAEVVETRLTEYAAKTAPLVPFYEARGLLRTVPADLGIDEVAARVAEALQSRPTAR